MKCPTYGDQYNSAMACKTEQEAKEWLMKEIKHYMDHHGKSSSEAEEIIKHNLGYMAGYSNHEAAQKVNRLFGAVHPIFGTASYHKELTAEDCIQAGIDAARRTG